MSALAGFLRPTALKAVFLAEWVLFILIEMLRGRLESSRQILVVSYPLAFFYLLACVLSLLSQRVGQIARGWRLLVLCASLTAVDQLGKAIVVALVPFRTSIPVIPDWLHLAHERNTQGSWLISSFDLPGISTAFLVVVAVLGVVVSLLAHRYYVSARRKSVWADIAFVGLCAGLASWACDVGLRGYIVDYIQLPGVVTADGKDILLTTGVAALLAETLENPKISLRWEGWRSEAREVVQLVRDVVRFYAEKLRCLQSYIQRIGKR